MKTTLCLALAFAFGALPFGTAAAELEKIRLSGTILDEAGKPVAGATVELFDPSQPQTQGPLSKADQAATTGVDGKFEFEFRTAGKSPVVFAAKSGLAPAWWSPWNVTEDIEEQLVLAKPTAVSGTVVDEAGQPVSQAQVWLSAGYLAPPDGARRTYYLPDMPHRERYTAQTGPDGKFSIQGLPPHAGFDFEVRTPGKVLRELARQYRAPDTMRLRAGQKEVKLVVESAGTVEGKLRAAASGEPIADATLTLVLSNPSGGMHPLRPVKTASDGTFKFTEVAPGSYGLHTQSKDRAGVALVTETMAVRVAAGRPTRGLELNAVKPGFVAATVLWKDEHQGIREVNVSAVSQTFTASAVTDAAGLARLAVVPGSYQVSAYHEQASKQQNVEVAEGQTEAVTLEFDAPQRITGLVLDAQGKPAANLPVRFIPEYRARTSRPLKTDAQGRFSFVHNQANAQPNERCSIIVRDAKNNLAAAAELDPDTRKVELKLAPGLTISGRVQDVKGNPLPRAAVSFYFWSGNMGASIENSPSRSDAQGRFSISGLPSGSRYSAQASAKGFGSESRQISAEEADGGKVELEPFALNVADQKLAGKVVDAEDKPVANAYVNIYGQGQPNDSVRTDADGFFKFNEVCEGTVQLSASAQSSYGNVRADAGDTNVVLKLGENGFTGMRPTPKRPSLKGKPLPDLTAVGLPADCVPAGKPVLLCLFDVEQRPSRRFTRQLAEQRDALAQKGLTVLGLQAAVSSAETLKEWKDANPVSFPVGFVPEKNEQTKWATEVESMPWLILADKEGKVAAEGFSFEDVEAQVQALTR